MIIIPDDNTNIMLDLEVLSCASNAAIISIGAVHFNAEDILNNFYQVIDLDSCLRYGRKVDGATLAWWMHQSEEARAVFQETKTVSLTQCLLAFTSWCNHCKKSDNAEDIAMWGNGSDFDNVILQEAYSRCCYTRPWNFRSNRCYRTIKNTFSKVPKREFEGVEHNALADAENQAQHLIVINEVAKKLYAA